MDIKALRYFVELIEQQSFTRASERLFVTQPTISKMIRSLEQEIGHPLLHRQGHRFWLTEAGHIVLTRAQEILAQMSQLQAELTDLTQLKTGQLRLGIPPMVGHLYADIIGQYRAAYPNVEITIVEYGGRKIEQAVLEGELDVAITMLSENEPSDLSSLTLDSYPIYAVLPNCHPWSSVTHIDWLTLKEQPFYLYTKEFILSDYIQQQCHNCGFSPQVAARSSQWDFLVALVKGGVGVTFLPEPICNRIQNDGLLTKAITPSITWTLGVIWHNQRYLARTTEAWIQLCQHYQRSRHQQTH